MTVKRKLADHGRLLRHYGNGQAYVDFFSVGECMTLAVILTSILAVQRAERESSGEVIEVMNSDWAVSASTCFRRNWQLAVGGEGLGLEFAAG